mmetsp:Transcript_18370/g.47331  ORF Transcript_18370/g.47331 Transcript_18370/m.47331 type:complete len:98 (-) Transcript_18370:153-446(-)
MLSHSTARGLPYADLAEARISHDLRKRVEELEAIERARREGEPKDYRRSAISESLNPRTSNLQADEQWFSRKNTYVTTAHAAEEATAGASVTRKTQR